MRFCGTLFASIVLARAQAPIIFPGGVVNAADYTTGGQTGQLLGAGSIASIFGANLAPAAESASRVPLPTEIEGTSVVVGGVSAPLFYVSPGQINLQIPSTFLTEQRQGDYLVTDVVVQNAAGVSAPYQITPGPAFGIFTQNASGCGQASALNIASDGTMSVNSPSNSASPGTYVALFGTGLGPASINNPPDGSPAPSSPLAVYTQTASSELGVGVLLDLPSPVSEFPDPYHWVGLAPGLVGVGQVNFMVPDPVREGCAVPIIAGYGDGPLGVISQPATIAIRQKGGPCADPPFAAYGQVTWSRTVATGTGSDGEVDAATVSLQGSPGRQAPESASFSAGATYNNYSSFGPACPVPGYRSLDVGVVTAQGPNLSPVQASTVPIPSPDNGQVSGLTQYQAVLPTGATQPGSFSVSAHGGADVGGFQAAVQVGSGIQITTPLPPGTVLSGASPININWKGGGANEWVTVRIVKHLGLLDQYAVAQTPASGGTVAFLPGYSFGNPPGPVAQVPVGSVEIDVEVDPDPSQNVAFSAGGLSLGGQATWKYVYRFGSITIQ